nr:unnamed protein product [Digitaria exilis]
MPSTSRTGLPARRKSKSRELPLVRVHVAADEVDGPEGARVRGEDALDRRDEAQSVDARGMRWASVKTSGEQSQTRCQRRESTAVRTASLTGRRETISRRSAKGRELMRSSPLEEAEGRAERQAAAETGGAGSEV